MENHVSLDVDQETGPIKTHGELASAILRKFCSKNVGWLEEESDEATYEKQILMTERGILLAEFLTQLKKPEKEEYSGYIFGEGNFSESMQTFAETDFHCERPERGKQKAVFFISKNPLPFWEYFQLIGFDIVVGRNNGVIMLSNYESEADSMNVQSNKMEIMVRNYMRFQMRGKRS